MTKETNCNYIDYSAAVYPKMKRRFLKGNNEQTLRVIKVIIARD